jgi:hypothetical protein
MIKPAVPLFQHFLSRWRVKPTGKNEIQCMEPAQTDYGLDYALVWRPDGRFWASLCDKFSGRPGTGDHGVRRSER